MYSNNGNNTNTYNSNQALKCCKLHLLQLMDEERFNYTQGTVNRKCSKRLWHNAIAVGTKDMFWIYVNICTLWDRVYFKSINASLCVHSIACSQWTHRMFVCVTYLQAKHNEQQSRNTFWRLDLLMRRRASGNGFLCRRTTCRRRFSFTNMAVRRCCQCLFCNSFNLAMDCCVK